MHGKRNQIDQEESQIANLLKWMRLAKDSFYLFALFNGMLLNPFDIIRNMV